MERWLAISLFLVWLSSVMMSSSLAAPYKPISKAEVVLKIPPSIAAISRQRKANISHEKLPFQPPTSSNDSLAQALIKARHFITLAKRDNNNRWYGFARSTIQPWLSNTSNNPEVALIKAHLYLLAHNFHDALSELNRVIAWRYDHPEALIMRANTYLMLSQYDKARRDCRQVALLSSPALGINCLARANALTGSADKALDQVLAVLKLKPILSPLVKFESHLNAAIFAHRLNKTSLANKHYNEALILEPNNPYLLEHYSDFLIEHDQWQKLATLISKTTDVMDQRIKLARYLKHHTDQSVQPLMAQIEDDFKRLKRINDDFPHKDYASYLLTLKQEPMPALTASLNNWDVQKDPSSALLVLRCALASRDFVRAQPVIEWVLHTQLYDHRIEHAIALLKRMTTVL